MGGETGLARLLLEVESNNRNVTFNPSGIDNEPIIFGPEQLEEQSSKLVQQVYRVGGHENSHAAEKMFASKGFEIKRLPVLLGEINPTSSLEPLSLAKTDVHGFLQHEYELMVTSVIEEAEENTKQAFHKNYTRNMMAEWRKGKKSITQSSNSQISNSINALNYGNNVSRQAGEESRRLYAGVVRDYVTERNYNNRHTNFIGACKDTIRRPEVLYKCWQFLDIFSQKLKPTDVNDPYRLVYLSKQTLEEEFSKSISKEEYLRDIRDPSESQWAELFYILRSGTWNEPNAVRSYSNSDPDVDKLLNFYMQEEERELGGPVHSDGRSGFPTSNRAYTGYKKAVFAILTRDSQYINNAIVRTIEDYAWIKLNSIPSDSNRSDYTLHRFREEIREEIKEKDRQYIYRQERQLMQHQGDQQQQQQQRQQQQQHWNQNSQKVYSAIEKFYIQLLSCDFAKGVESLGNSAGFEIDAVHFGLAMSIADLVDRGSRDHYDSSLIKLSYVQGLVAPYIRYYYQEKQQNFQSSCLIALVYLSLPTLDFFKEQVTRMAVDTLHDRKNDLRILLGERNGTQLHAGLIQHPVLGHENEIPQILETIAKEFQGKKQGKPSLAISIWDLAARKYEQLNNLDGVRVCEKAICSIFVEHISKIMLQFKHGEEMNANLLNEAHAFYGEYYHKSIENFPEFEFTYALFSDIYYPYRTSSSKDTLNADAFHILQQIKNRQILSFHEETTDQIIKNIESWRSRDLRAVCLTVIPEIALRTMLFSRDKYDKDTLDREVSEIIETVHRFTKDKKEVLNLKLLCELQRRIKFGE